MRIGSWGVRLSLTLAMVATAAVTTVTPASAASAELFIVQLKQSPVVAYTGDIAGLKATKPAKGTKIDPLSTAVVSYVDFLTTQHSKALAKVGATKKVYSYTYSYNGFSAKLTKAQADALRKQADVVAVTPNEFVEVDTSSTPTFPGPGRARRAVGATRRPDRRQGD